MSLYYSFICFNYIVFISCLTFSSIQSQSRIDTNSVDTDIGFMKISTLKNLVVDSEDYTITKISCSCSEGTIKLPNDYYYVKGLGSAYKLHTTNTTWNAARKICIEEGGHLAIVNSEVEANFLGDIMKYDIPYVHVGIHDLFEEGDWVSVLDEPLLTAGYAAWGQSNGIQQPENGEGVENCGMMWWDGKIADLACNIELPFFCEIKAL